jgi:hypothetical protein
MLVVGSLPAMQQVRDQKHQQQKRKTTKNDCHHQDQHNKSEIEDIEIADLKADAAAIVKAVENNLVNTTSQTSVASKTKPIEKQHERICPTCGRPAELCELDKSRIAQGNIMTCGCHECGGAVGPLWLSQCAESALEYVAKNAVAVFNYATKKISMV